MLKNIKRSLRRSFWNSIDNFFIFAFINFLWFIIHFVPIQILVLKEEFPGTLREFDIFTLISSHFLTSFPFVYRIVGEMAGPVRDFHQFAIFGSFLFFSPFSLAIWRLNAVISRSKSPSIGYFFIESFRQIPKSVMFIILVSLLLGFCSINISFYQNAFATLPIMAYLITFSILFLELFTFMCFLQAMPIMINENKKIIPSLKRSYLFIIHCFPSTCLLFLFFWIILSVIYYELFSIPGLTLMFFIYPAFWGQFMNENYLTSAEYFGLSRITEEKRSIKKWFFPKKASR